MAYVYSHARRQQKPGWQAPGQVNIRESIKNFDDDEVRVRTTDTNHRERTATYLTEMGLYRLLGQSRKPQARPFQKWVAGVVRDM